MPSKIESLLLAATISLSAACLLLAAQAGYLNALSGDTPVLWRSRYDRAQLRVEDLTDKLNSSEAKVNGLEAKLTALESEYESCVSYASTLAEESINLSKAVNRTARERDDLHQLLTEVKVELEVLRSNMSDVREQVEFLEDENSQLGLLLSAAVNRTSEFQEAISLEGEIYRSYTWNYVTERRKDGEFNRTEYLTLATGNHIEDTDEESYPGVVNTAGNAINELADYLYNLGGATDLQRVNNILKFVQYLSYIRDYDNDNYVRYPLETLIEGGGDCEDTSTLAASLLGLAGDVGFPVVLFTVDTDNDQEVDHMMVGVSFDGATGKSHEVNGFNYYVCETTSRWYVAGQLPSGYKIVRAIQLG